jgi:cytochrome P450
MRFDLSSLSGDFIENPYPALARLRSTEPVYQLPDGSFFLTRYADVQHLYQSRNLLSDKSQEFRSKFGQTPLFEHHTTSLVFNDPPYHTVVRKLLAGAFTPRKLVEMEARVRKITDSLLDQLADKREIDLISDFATELPTRIISFMLGIPESHRAELRGFSLAILGALDPAVSQERMAAGNAAVLEFSNILDQIITHRRANPGQAEQGDVLDNLIHGSHEGRHLSQSELIQNCIFLLNAGHETTTSLVSNGVGLLLENPDQLAALRADPRLIDGAVEEILRLESPLQMGNRRANETISLDGSVLPIGSYFHTSIAAANRDPAQFADPDRMDITRTPNRHLAFITGIHVCLGATLARIEGRIALGRLVQRFSDFIPSGPAVRLPLARFRGWQSFPLRLG